MPSWMRVATSRITSSYPARSRADRRRHRRCRNRMRPGTLLYVGPKESMTWTEPSSLLWAPQRHRGQRGAALLGGGPCQPQTLWFLLLCTVVRTPRSCVSEYHVLTLPRRAHLSTFRDHRHRVSARCLKCRARWRDASLIYTNGVSRKNVSYRYPCDRYKII